MHVTLTRVDTEDQPIGNATIVAEEMHRWLRDMEGFEGLLIVAREGEAIGLTFWQSSDVAERQQVVRDEFRERMMSVAGVAIEEVVDYEVSFAKLGPALADFAG